MRESGVWNQGNLEPANPRVRPIQGHAPIAARPVGVTIPRVGQTGRIRPALIPFDSWHDGFYNQITGADSLEEAYRVSRLGTFFRRSLHRYLSRVTYFNKPADRIAGRYRSARRES